jgi:phospholipid/cholesterol/gamma-HCH transport system permease protein
VRIVNRSIALPPAWNLERHEKLAILHLGGDWISCETGVRSAGDVDQIVEAVGTRTLRLETSSLGRWDSALIAFLAMLHDSARKGQTRPVEIDESGLPHAARRLLALAVAGTGEVASIAVAHRSLMTQVGEAYFDAWANTVAIVSLVGETALLGAAALAHGARTRVVDVFQLVREAGAGALAIVAIVNGLVGAILGFIGAVQFQRFGAGIYVANLVGIAVVREMAALATAIVMAGRTGGAYAAHLATMQENEEIDALNAVGIPVFDFLVLPRIIALVSMMPLLYLYSCAVGLLGGFIVSLATLDINAAIFLQQLRGAVDGAQFAIGLAKSLAFGAFIALAGCHIGLTAGRSAENVGRAATSAVVAGIVGVISLDAVFAVCTNALGI